MKSRIFYGPEFLQPRRIEHLVSQIDIAPSILGVLNISYRSRFVGADQINGVPKKRALISTYEKIALMRDGKLIILGPRRDISQYEEGEIVDAAQVDDRLLFDAVTYYQYASRWKRHFRQGEFCYSQSPKRVIVRQSAAQPTRVRAQNPVSTKGAGAVPAACDRFGGINC